MEFDRFDEGLTVTFGVFWASRFRFVPVPEGLNRYMLAVKGFPEGKYDMLADGRPLGTFSSDRLAAVVSVNSATAEETTTSRGWTTPTTAGRRGAGPSSLRIGTESLLWWGRADPPRGKGIPGYVLDRLPADQKQTREESGLP